MSLVESKTKQKSQRKKTNYQYFSLSDFEIHLWGFFLKTRGFFAVLPRRASSALELGVHGQPAETDEHRAVRSPNGLGDSCKRGVMFVCVLLSFLLFVVFFPPGGEPLVVCVCFSWWGAIGGHVAQHSRAFCTTSQVTLFAPRKTSPLPRRVLTDFLVDWRSASEKPPATRTISCSKWSAPKICNGTNLGSDLDSPQKLTVPPTPTSVAFAHLCSHKQKG